MLETDPLLKGQNKTFEEFLSLQEQDIKNKRVRAQLDVDYYKEEAARRANLPTVPYIDSSYGSLTKEEKNNATEAGLAVNRLTEALIFLEQIRNKPKKESKTGGQGSNFILKMLREQQDMELNVLKQGFQDRLAQGVQSDIEKMGLEYEFEQKYLALQKKFQEEQLLLVKEGGLEYAKIQTDIEDTVFKIKESSAKNKLAVAKYEADEAIRFAREVSDAEISDAYKKADKRQLALVKANSENLKNAKNDSDEIVRIKAQESADLIKIEWDELQNSVDRGFLEEQDREIILERIRQLEIAHAKAIRALDDKTTENKIKNNKKLLRETGDVINQGFELAQQYFEKEKQASEKKYRDQTKFASTSIEKRLSAEKAYNKEQLAIKRKQAIADKLQAAFNIGLELALASAKLSFPQIAAATLALAAVVAKPIPAFEKGGKHKGGLARVSEKGSELHIGDDGTVSLTPDNETVANFGPGEFIPHDDTQRILANYAVSQSNDSVDMSRTNGFLKSIDNNTKNRANVMFNGKGQKVIKRGYLTTTIS